MDSPPFQPTYLEVTNEGANLRVWHQGSGPLLILIQGGGGDGARFNASIPRLSEHYTVATYDRRGNGDSKVIKPKPLNPVESARDVVAIVKALGFEKASVFGTSSGGMLALQLAASYPEYIEHAVIHEAPLVTLLVDENADRIDDTFDVYETFLRYGAEAALERFRASGAGKKLPPVEERSYPDVEDRQSQPPHRLDYFFGYEFVVLCIYTPPLAQIRANGVSVATVEGSENDGVFYVTSARLQAEALDCEHVVWPGAHAPFMTDPEEFARSLRKTLVMLDGKKQGQT